MQLRIGHELAYVCQQATPMILTVNVHYSRVSDIVRPDYLVTRPSIPIVQYRDGFGNWCSRLVAPKGHTTFTCEGIVRDTGAPDTFAGWAKAVAVEDLPEETLPFLLGSRYCETDQLSEIAWSLFGASQPGGARVQAVCDFVHGHVVFGYEHARPTKSAWQVYRERNGVCRDYAHLAIALCRCLNIPARYCTGYLSDVGVPPPHAPMDFAAWFDAYLGGQWYTFDPRNNVPRIGRVLIARGRDAADVAIITTFGPNKLENFRVWTEELG